MINFDTFHTELRDISAYTFYNCPLTWNMDSIFGLLHLEGNQLHVNIPENCSLPAENLWKIPYFVYLTDIRARMLLSLFEIRKTKAKYYHVFPKALIYLEV